MELDFETTKKEIGLFIAYEVLIVIMGNFFVLIFVNYWFTVTVYTKDDMFEKFDEGEYQAFLDSWDAMKKIRRLKAFFGFLLAIIVCFFSYMFVFAFCVVYAELEMNIIIGFFLAVFIDAFIYEFTIELFVLICVCLDFE